MERTVVAVSVSNSEVESVGRIRRMMSEVHQLCLSFENSVELATFLTRVSAAQVAFEQLMQRSRESTHTLPMHQQG